MAKWLAVLAAVLALSQCSLQSSPTFEFQPVGWYAHNPEAVEPTREQETGFNLAYICAKEHQHDTAPQEYTEVAWVVADSITPKQGNPNHHRPRAVASWNHLIGPYIITVRGFEEDTFLAWHESLHHIIGIPVPHEDPRFETCDPLSDQ